MFLVASAIINPQHGQRQDNLLVVRIEEKRVNRRQQECVVFRCEAFTCEVYCVKRFAKVDIMVALTAEKHIVENLCIWY